jgi:hypothetical protein
VGGGGGGPRRAAHPTGWFAQLTAVMVSVER